MTLNLVLDFDGTMADTFKPSPNEIGVGEAYCLAVEDLFGNQGEKVFWEVGGLKNRAPIELLQAIQKQGLVMNGNLENNAERLVSAKLKILLGEIGPDWPLPCLGYREFNMKLFQLRQNGANIRLAILSSGHLAFIEKTLRIWEKNWESPVIWPDVIISDDDLRHLPVSVEQKTKPSSFLFKLIKEKMGEGKFFYFGDDPEKDGKLAMNSGVPFGWFISANNKNSLPPEVVPFLIFENWEDVNVA